jgi:ubiquinol-cytochrome c reductase cytochrome c1 subunit
VRYLILVILLSLPQWVLASGAHVHLDQANIDLHDRDSLYRGAKLFTSYCLSCHSAAFMRYNRIGKDLGLSEDELQAELVKPGSKTGDTMNIVMTPKDAKRWFGTAPPDLSVLFRVRGADWIYTYLRSFYRDESRPWGVNNAVFKDVAMPHVLWELQGLQEAETEKHVDEKGVEHERIVGFKLVEPGKLSPTEYDAAVHDLVNFLAYLSEPSKLTRLAMGKWVLAFLVVFFVLVFFLKKEYWRDIH